MAEACMVRRKCLPIADDPDGLRQREAEVDDEAVASGIERASPQQQHR